MSLQNPNLVNPELATRIDIVIANPAISISTGWPVGFWWSELSHPYFAFTEAGFDVQFFSPNGGACQCDGMSDPSDASGYSKTDLISQGFIHTPELMALVQNTGKVADIDVARFDAIVLARGQAPMSTYQDATDLHEKFVAFYTSGKIAAALCHGISILRYAKLPDGEFLAKGKTVTGLPMWKKIFLTTRCGITTCYRATSIWCPGGLKTS